MRSLRVRVRFTFANAAEDGRVGVGVCVDVSLTASPTAALIETAHRRTECLQSCHCADHSAMHNEDQSTDSSELNQ